MGREASSSVTIQWGIMWADVPGVLLCSSVEWVGGGRFVSLEHAQWCWMSGVHPCPNCQSHEVSGRKKVKLETRRWRVGGWAGWSPDLPRW